MSNDSITSQTLQNYTYPADKPIFTKGNYQIFNAVQK
jgi:hypothetical protein